MTNHVYFKEIAHKDGLVFMGIFIKIFRMEFIDYYKILGLDKSADEETIKKAYRKLAHKHHPDLNPNDKDANNKFQQLNEANQVLSDPEKRKKYDKYGKDWERGEEFEKYKQSQQQRPSANEGQNFSGNYGEADFSDFFESMFGGQTKGRKQAKYKGQDYNTEVELSLKEAFTTHQKTFTINGKAIRITIPAGIEHGQTIKLTGHGAKGINNGPDGDLFITFSIANTTDFKRLGNDLYTTKELTLYQAILGNEIVLDTLSGTIKLKVAAETQNGTKIRLKGKGFAVYKKEGEFGDLYVNYVVKIPTHLTEKQKALFEELAELSK